MITHTASSAGADKRVPAPPPDLLMQIANDPGVDSFLNSLPHVRTAVADYLGRAGYRFDQFSRTLDFGCGVGRFLFAMHEVAGPGQQLHGCDIDARCADWCRANIDFATVIHSTLEPPLPYADGEFDFVYALSVFTHLSLELQFAWAWEIARILKPGGVLFVSTHGLMFMQQIMAIRDNWARADIAVFGTEGLAGAFAENADRANEGQRAIATVHNPVAVREIFSGLTLKYHDPVSYMAGGQSITVLEKPQHSGRPLLPLEAAGFAAALDVLAAGALQSGGRRFRFPAVAVPASLRFYLTFSQPRRDCGRFAVGCRIIRSADGVVVHEESLDLPLPAVSGDRHFLPLVVSVPLTDGPLEVELHLCLQAGKLPSAAALAFSWHFLRIE